MQASIFYNNLATALRAEVTNANLRDKIANRLADIFEQADTPETFNRVDWLNLVRNG